MQPIRPREGASLRSLRTVLASVAVVLVGCTGDGSRPLATAERHEPSAPAFETSTPAWPDAEGRAMPWAAPGAPDAQVQLEIQLMRRDLWARRYDLVGARMDAALQSRRKSLAGLWLYERFVRAISGQPAYEGRLREWLAAEPDNSRALVSLAALLGKEAWDRRGVRFADDVTDRGWAGFQSLGGEALTLLGRAHAIDPEDPVALMLRVRYRPALSGLSAQDLADHAAAQELAPDLVEVDNDLYGFVAEKWSGRPGAQAKFLEEILTRRPPSPTSRRWPLTLYEPGREHDEEFLRRFNSEMLAYHRRRLERQPLSMRDRHGVSEYLAYLGRMEEFEEARSEALLAGLWPDGLLTAAITREDWEGFQRWWRRLDAYQNDLLAEDDPVRLSHLRRLIGYHDLRGETTEALRVAREVHAWSARIHGADHPVAATDALTLGNMLTSAGEWVEAGRVTSEAIEALRRVYGPGTKPLLQPLANLAFNYQVRGRLQKAVETCEELLPAVRLHAKKGDFWMGHYYRRCAGVYTVAGDWVEAADAAGKSLGVEPPDAGWAHAVHARRLEYAADLQRRRGKLSSARRYLDRAQSARSLVMRPKPVDLARHEFEWGRFLVSAGHAEEAQRRLERALEAFRALGEGSESDLLETRIWLALSEAELGWPDASRTTLLTLRDELAGRWGAVHQDILLCDLEAARLAAAEGDAPRALHLLDDALSVAYRLVDSRMAEAVHGAEVVEATLRQVGAAGAAERADELLSAYLESREEP